MKKIDNSQAQNEFVALVGEIQALITRLQGAIDNHFDLNPEDIHWGHVGDLGRVTQTLDDLLATIEGHAA
ncbi:hypothetical protein CCAE64S_02582 [Castellaniella caeni]